MPARRRPPYVAYLRVYEPVDHLPKAPRDRWTAYARSVPPLLEQDQYAESVRRLAARPPAPVPEQESEDALVLQVDGVLYVCPHQPRLQAWRQLGAMDEPAPGVLDQILPQQLREQAAADLAAYAQGGGELRTFSRLSSWHVPVAWFVPFAAQDRQLELGPQRSLRYRTAMSAARRRCAHGLRTARAHLSDTDVIDDIEQVARWLEDFDSRSLVELDYAGLVELLDDAHLRGDDSAADVGEGLAALADHDPVSAAAAYRRWSVRWRRVALLANSS